MDIGEFERPDVNIEKVAAESFVDGGRVEARKRNGVDEVNFDILGLGLEELAV